jgi:NAD(P)-dependent dehydrogenase (short-subunit alcohol dehydrogenase family)
VLVRPADVTSEADVAALYADAEGFGETDILVNNAGMVSHSPTLDCTLDHWNDVIGLNLTAAFLCAREAMRVMVPRKRGKIINIGSLSGQIPRQDTIAYTSSKFAMEGMTRSLALDGRAHGITASICHPGMTMSELAGDAMGEAGPMRMEADTTAQLIALMASMPFDANLLTATILPIAQPYLGRG